MTLRRFGSWRRNFSKILETGRGTLPRLEFAGRLQKARGREVHAGSLIRERRIVLESLLRNDPRELRRIYVHELFHFVWVKLGNPRRWAFERVLRDDWRARGELGWSAEWRKRDIAPSDVARRTKRWREYCCEAFCDTAAWMFSDVKSHEEFTLANRHRERRAACLRRMMSNGRFPI